MFFVLFQATISLLIGYEPPASAISNPNAQVDGDASAGEAGQLLLSHCRIPEYISPLFYMWNLESIDQDIEQIP